MDTAAELLLTLRSSGVTLVAMGDRIRYRPREAVSPEMLAAIAAHKTALLGLLREQVPAQSKAPDTPVTELDDGQVGAVLIDSRVLGCEVWLVRDADALNDIAAEVGNRPVFFFDEIEHLRGKSEEELRAIAKVKCAFGPGARVVQ